MYSPLEHESMFDENTHVKKVGAEFAKSRKPHLEKLKPLVEMAKNISTLPVVYDITRLHHPYFSEYTYTEFLGCLYIAPQSAEVSARLVDYAAKTPYSSDYNIVDSIFARLNKDQNLDKYTLEQKDFQCSDDVIFIPGDNIFKTIVSRELLTTYMTRHENCMIKPHPMTNHDLLRVLGREFGYRRVIDPLISGWDCLNKSKRVYCTTSTEMGIYAVLLDKPIYNIGNYFFEARGAYSAFYRLLWDLSPVDAKTTLVHVLNSPYSGVFHPDDPLFESKMKMFFDKSMEIRELMKPLVHEIGFTEWSDIQMSRQQPQPPSKG